MKDSPQYRISQGTADAFVAGQRHGMLMAAAPGGFPSVTILPFVRSSDMIELHCVRADPTFAALRANPQVTFLVSDFLAAYPHEWVDPADMGRASLAYRAVNFECEATWDLDPAAVAAALTRLTRAYTPEANYPPFPDDDFYGPRLRLLVVLRLRILRLQITFKVGPPGADEGPRRANVAAELRKRGGDGDARAADWIDYYNEMQA